MTERDALLDRGREAFARGAFREAHEHWEDAWRRSTPPDRPVVQALAQLAAAAVHLTRGQRRGAASVLGKARAKLAGAPVAAVGSIAVSSIDAAIAALQRGADPRSIAV